MKWIVDRFENGYAIVELEDGKVVNIPREAMPQDVCEGDIVELETNKNETQEKREEIKKRLNKLFID